MRMDFELGVFVAYRWEWVDLAEVRDNDDEVDDVDDDDHDHNTDNEQGSDGGGEDGNSEVDGVRLPYITHKVIFKCIGSNREVVSTCIVEIKAIAEKWTTRASGTPTRTNQPQGFTSNCICVSNRWQVGENRLCCS